MDTEGRDRRVVPGRWTQVEVAVGAVSGSRSSSRQYLNLASQSHHDPRENPPPPRRFFSLRNLEDRSSSAAPHRSTSTVNARWRT